MVNRRSAIRQLVCLSAGALLIPSCMEDKSKSSILLKNITIDGKEEKTIEELAEIIIPKTDTPGGKDIYAQLFVLKMIDDCYSKEEQEKYITGLKDFNKEYRSRFNKSFIESSPEERKKFVSVLEGSKDTNSYNHFYNVTKRLSVQAYTTSEFYLTKIHVYEMIPGRYHGCMPVDQKVSKPS